MGQRLPSQSNHQAADQPASQLDSQAGLSMESQTPKKLLIAASGTGGHLFPAIAVAQQLSQHSSTQ